MSDYRDERAPADPVEWSTRAGEAESDRFRDQPYGEYDVEALRWYRPVQPESTLRTVLRRLWAPLAAIVFLVWKFKAAALAIFKFKLFTVAGSARVARGVDATRSTN